MNEHIFDINFMPKDWDRWESEKISKERVCSAHFVSGKRSDDPSDVDWSPSVFNHLGDATISSLIKKRKRKDCYKALCKKRSFKKSILPSSQSNHIELDNYKDNINNDINPPNDKSAISKFCQHDTYKVEVETLNFQLMQHRNELIEKSNEIIELKKKNARLDHNKYIPYQNLTDEQMNFFSGLSRTTFMWLLERVKNYIKKVHLRVVNLIVWPDRGIIRSNLSICFKKKFKDCVCIIDCTEIFIEGLKNLTSRSQTWSNYKHNNTIKYLIGITPAGAVSFLSPGWGGRVSDKQITFESNFCQKLYPGDCVLADRGFNIKDELNAVGATLKVPAFTKGRQQLSG
ncbi:uncharacterized protein LOC136095754 [Hydra vulgaris]|uniref:uncharacterized protein LOC136095754 n=1 Tax=Hydra vulgaris TaxID=6087 RepID=UPI0032EA8E67